MMKNEYITNRKGSISMPAGFALVVSLTMMVLLVVTAVGLLALSSISLRSASQGEAMAQARSNARMAMILALGELQKTCGPDRAITAQASVVNPSNPHGLTGVWRPWDTALEPLGSAGTSKDDRFERWLVSSPDPARVEDMDRIPLAAPGAGASVVLLGDGSLGPQPRHDGDQRIALPPCRIGAAPSPGGYAWAVIDESSKARLDLHDQPGVEIAANLMRVAAPPVDGIAALDGLANFSTNAQTAAKLASLETAHLHLGGTRESMQRYSPELSVNSSSLLTDVVRGGLKQDLSLWFSRGLNATERNLRLYRDAGVIAGSIAADPMWAYLEAFHESYKMIGRSGAGGDMLADGITTHLPARHRPSRDVNTANPTVLSEPLLMPTVLRVDVIFSLITRDVHGGRTNNLRNRGRPYMLHLLYLPVVTLHNPYHVPMSVEGLKVNFRNLPIAFQFMLNDEPLTNGFAPLNQLYAGSNGDPGRTKDFGCTLTSSLGSSGSGSSFILQPGQTMLFGTPRVTPDWTWANEEPGVARDGLHLFDWRNDKTTDFRMSQRLMTDPRIGNGFDIDWLAPTGLQTDAGRASGVGEGIVSLTGNERIGVRFAPFAPTAGGGSFNIIVQVIQRGQARYAGHFTYRYGTEQRLNEILSQGTSRRFPTPRRFPESFPVAPFDRPLRTMDLYEPNNRAIKDYINPKPFAIFSLGARTSMESFIPTRNFADGNPTIHTALMDVTRRNAPLGEVPLEMVLMPIRNGNAAIEEIRQSAEAFAFGGSGSLHGTPRATFYEFPVAPLQSIAQLRHANLAGSGITPQTTYTVGESLAHPVVGSSDLLVRLADRSVALDHTWLGNAALWDRYFFSTLADQTSFSFGRDRNANEVMKQFFDGAERLPNQRFRPAANRGLNPGNLNQNNIAGHLFLDGGFNVNSASEDAWVAILSALRESPIATLAGVETSGTGDTPLPRVNRPVGGNIDQKPLAMRVDRWEGYRALTDSQIRGLAREIVIEVRNRGPFLSLSEFVNREVGPESNPRNLSGAIQAAIDRVPGLNQIAHVDGIELTEAMLANHGYNSVAAGSGNTATFAPGSITQGDILTPLGSRIVVRGDTFRIRAYGEATAPGGNGRPVRAYCEAIVQRIPDYVDENEDVALSFEKLANDVNRTFGRKFNLVSFRWLHPAEV